MLFNHADSRRHDETAQVRSPAGIVKAGAIDAAIFSVVPILQERGAYKRDYEPGTLREKLFGRQRLLPAHHPAAVTAE